MLSTSSKHVLIKCIAPLAVVRVAALFSVTHNAKTYTCACVGTHTHTHTHTHTEGSQYQTTKLKINSLIAKRSYKYLLTEICYAACCLPGTGESKSIL